MFTAHAAIELYAEVFAAANALDKLPAFACENGPRFYGLPTNEQRLPRSFIEVYAEPWVVPASYEFGGDVVIPVRAGETLPYKARVVVGE